MQALLQQGALESTLASAPAELVAALLHHVRRQLGSPQHVGNAVAVTQCLLACCPAAVLADGTVQERLQQLRGAVAEELRTQEELLELAGMVGAARALAV